MRKNLLLLIALTLVLSLGAQNYPLVKIADLQKVSDQDLANGNDASPRIGDTVEVEGIVTFDPCVYGLSATSRKGTWLQDPDTNAWNGIHVLIDPGAIGGGMTMADLDLATKFFDNFKKGNKVHCTGIVSAFSNNTQIVLLPVETQIVGLSSVPAPHLTTVDTFMKSDGGGGQIPQLTTGEQYEGVLVEFRNVTIVDVATFAGGTRINWTLQDEKGNEIRVRDVSGWFRNDENDNYCKDTTETPWVFPLPNEGSQLSWFRGIILDYALGGERQYWIAPRDTNDIGPLVAAAPVVRKVSRMPVQATSSNSVTITATIVDPDGTVAKADLFFSKGQGNTNFTRLPMINVQGNDWSSSIPPSGQDGAIMNFWIRAIDNSGDTTDYPFTGATNMNYITLDDGINEIKDLQYTIANGPSIWSGDSLTGMSIHAVVTSTQEPYDLGLIAVQDSRDPFSGIILQRVTGDQLGELRRGDSILLKVGMVSEVFGVTNLSFVQYDLLGKGTVPEPITGLNPDSIAAGVFDQAEAYEAMFVKFPNAFVVDTNADGPNNNFGEWAINTSLTPGSGLRVDDYSNDIPFGFNVDSMSLGQQLDYIQGILWYSFGNYKLEPRNQSDIAGFHTEYPKRITLFSFLGLGPGGTDVILNIDNDNNLIYTTDPLPAGTDISNLAPYIEYEGESLTPGSGVAQDFRDTVYYTVTAPVDASSRTYAVLVDVAVGIGLPQGLKALSILPNPGNGVFNLNLEVNEAADYRVYIYSMTGRELLKRNWNVNSGTNRLSLDLSELGAGMYLIRLEGAGGVISRKLQIVK